MCSIPTISPSSQTPPTADRPGWCWGRLWPPPPSFGASDGPRWLLFHDPRDVLSLPTKPLFGNCPWIEEEWVENKVSALAPADRFEETHNGTWFNPQVIASTRRFLRQACGLSSPTNPEAAR
jgi:hypothetical protein